MLGTQLEHRTKKKTARSVFVKLEVCPTVLQNNATVARKVWEVQLLPRVNARVNRVQTVLLCVQQVTSVLILRCGAMECKTVQMMK